VEGDNKKNFVATVGHYNKGLKLFCHVQKTIKLQILKDNINSYGNQLNGEVSLKKEFSIG
jgi:hypothetical protein